MKLYQPGVTNKEMSMSYSSSASLYLSNPHCHYLLGTQLLIFSIDSKTGTQVFEILCLSKRWFFDFLIEYASAGKIRHWYFTRREKDEFLQ